LSPGKSEKKKVLDQLENILVQEIIIEFLKKFS